MCVHMCCAPTTPNQGLDARDQSTLGRQRLLETPFDKLEHDVRDQLSRQLAGSSFDEDGISRALPSIAGPMALCLFSEQPDQTVQRVSQIVTPLRKPYVRICDARFAVATTCARLRHV